MYAVDYIETEHPNWRHAYLSYCPRVDVSRLKALYNDQKLTFLIIMG